MKIAYIERRFSESSLEIIVQADEIMREYAEQGYQLTLRQLYYQFVARDLLPNTQRSYKRLGSIINDARLAGCLDWEHLVDRTRELRANPHWESPEDIVAACAKHFALDKWADQRARVEVWIEKDALVGVIAAVCEELDVPYFSCRGYASQSEVWAAGQRFRKYIKAKQAPVVLHFADHDPSGIDMTRDLSERIKLFIGWERDCVFRVALHMEHIEQYQPPPNPAKITDSRFAGYMERFGRESWELDALEPAVLAGLVREHVEAVRMQELWDAKLAQEEAAKQELAKVAGNWKFVRKQVQKR